MSNILFRGLRILKITFSWGRLRWTPHPVIVTIRENRDYIRVLLDSYYTTISGWGVLLREDHFEEAQATEE